MDGRSWHAYPGAHRREARRCNWIVASACRSSAPGAFHGSYGIAETHYFADAAQRRQFGQAFANHSADSRLQMVAFWTTPWIDTKGAATDGAAYPFAIEDYLPKTRR